MKSLFVLFAVILPSMAFSEGNCVKGINLKEVCGVDDWKKNYSSTGNTFIGAIWKHQDDRNFATFVAGKVQRTTAKNLSGLIKQAKIVFEEKEFSVETKFSNKNLYVAAISSKKAGKTFYQGYFKNYKNEFINLNCMVEKSNSPWSLCRRMFEQIGEVKI